MHPFIYAQRTTRFLRDAEGKGGGGDNGGTDAGKEGGNEDAGKAGDDAAENVETLKKKLAEYEDKVKGLSDEKAKLLKDTMKHKDLVKERDKALAELHAQLKDTLGDDLTLDDVKKIVADRKEREEKKLKEKGDFDTLRDRMAKEHQKALADATGKKDSEIEELKKGLDVAKGQIRTLLVSNAFASSQYLAENLTLTPSKAERLYGENFKVEEKDGRAVVVAYLDGEPLVNAEGKALSFDEAFKEIVNRDPERDFLMKSKAKEGAGSGSDNEAGKLPEPKVRGAARIATAMKK